MKIRELYFDWLYRLVLEVKDPDSPLSYVSVCTHLHQIRFKDNVPNDDNRSAEGKELRNEFIASLRGIEVGDYAEIYSLGKASLFEMMVALTRRADFDVEIGPGKWFMIFLSNLGLTKFSDSRFVPRDSFRVERILKTLNDRSYNSSGKGGLFPLKDPEEDQRSVELWYQMAAFMTENRMY